MKEDWNKQRNGIIGLGENSFKKSYYPDLQSKIVELEEANTNLQTIFNSTNDGILIHDERGNILSLNNQSKKIFNLKEEDKEKYTIFDLSSKQMSTDDLTKIWQEVLDGKPKVIEWIIQQAETEVEICLQVSINKAFWYGKQVLVAVVRDFTERVKYEQELFQAKIKAEESDRLKTVFLHNLSHEIRTPMNGIIGFSDMLTLPDITPDKLNYYTKIIKNSSLQLLRIIDDILEISTLETKQVKANIEEVCLNDLLVSLFAIFNLKTKEGNISLSLKKQFCDEESFILTDKIKLHKILSNIIENALKYTSEGYVEISYSIEKDDLVFCVKDSGIGIASDNLEKIFNRFSQDETNKNTKVGGLGLGLSIAKENANLLGGKIHVVSEKGKGSAFYVTIPYKPINANLH